MTHTYEELKKKTVVELREIAAGIEHEACKVIPAGCPRLYPGCV
mgnify:CR=1 FL=1